MSLGYLHTLQWHIYLFSRQDELPFIDRRRGPTISRDCLECPWVDKGAGIGRHRPPDPIPPAGRCDD